MPDFTPPPPVHVPIVAAIDLQRHAASLLLYQAVLQSPIAQTFLNLLQLLATSEPDLSCLRAYGDWFHAQASEQLGWQEHLIGQLLTADNPFAQQAHRHQFAKLAPSLVAAAQQDLRSLHQLYRCDGTQISQWVQAQANLLTAPIVWQPSSTTPLEPTLSLLRQQPIWTQLQISHDWGTLIEALAAHYHQFGSGVFASYRAFRWQDGQLVGIAYPDPIHLNELVGYEQQKATLLQNTEALLRGYPALHVLLYGSRGSGKSSLVKALLPAYGASGLRLVEVSKAALKDLPTIVDILRNVPQRFIIFVDDLSFEEDDDAYKALKVVLEGNLTARPPNVVVYATSNRRHLIREFFGDRPRPSEADEIHQWDTVQEKLSFSDRFGLTLTFEPADQTTYLEIVQHLAQQAGLAIDPQALEFRALQWATRHNGRSGRTARQFVDFLRSETAISPTA
jgi:predicted AAA+ superfamily ATPase